MSINDIIQLNVGGRQVATSRSTLVSVPGSVLAATFDPESERTPAIAEGSLQKKLSNLGIIPKFV